MDAREQQAVEYLADNFTKQISAALNETLNSRQARRERLLAGVLSGYCANPNDEEWKLAEMVAYVEQVLDASDALTEEEPNGPR